MSDKFDSRVVEWNEYMQTPWGRMQNSTRLHNLRRHLPDRPLEILDAGGGNGVETLPLAMDGHHLTLLDGSEAMLADGERISAEKNITRNVTTIQGSVLDLAQLVQQKQYDIVLLHNVIQYIDEALAPSLLDQLYASTKPGGLLSLVSVNRHSNVLAKSIVHAEFDAALAQIDSKQQYSRAFDHTVRTYDAEEMTALLQASQFEPVEHYGVRIFIDYIADNALKHDPVQFAKMEALERELSDKIPYKHLARTFQLIAQRPV